MQATNDAPGSNRQVGGLIRDWRLRRRLTQLALAVSAALPRRALGAWESGKAQPPFDAILRLAERMDLPLRDRNRLLVAAGYPPHFPVRRLTDAALASVKGAIDQMLVRQQPYPALAIDGRWIVVAANDALRGLIAGVDPALLRPPVNWARLLLHPAGLAPRIANLSVCRAHLLARLSRQFEMIGEPVLADLLEEIGDYPVPKTEEAEDGIEPDAAAQALCLMTVDGPLRLFGTSTVFGMATDITLAELTIESFFPADADAAAIMLRLAEIAVPRAASG